MIRRTALAVALVTGALLVGTTTPAHADETPEVRCRATASNFRGELTAIAYYHPFHLPGLRVWDGFSYRVDLLGAGGDKSNVNIRVHDGNQLVREIKSPDDRRDGSRYTLRLTRDPIYTRTEQVDGSRNDVVAFEGIFDRSRRSDPRCTVFTAPV